MWRVDLLSMDLVLPLSHSIEGDYTNVVGISMPFVRKAFAQLGYTWPQVKVMK